MANDKELIILHGVMTTPPMSEAARIEAGRLLRGLQRGQTLTLPHSRAMPSTRHAQYGQTCT